MAMYAYPRTCLRSYIVPSGSNRFDVSQVLSDRAPSLLVVGLVNAQAFGGSLNTNPYHLEHFDLNYIGFQLNSSLKAGPALEPDFGASSFAEAYSSFHELSQGKGNGITQSDHKKGNALFCFNLQPHLTNLQGDVYPVMRKAHSRLEIRFKKALTKSCVVVCYMISPGLFKISESRNVFVDF